MRGGDNDDRIDGGANGDTIRGDAGSDWLYGGVGDGDDTIYGGADNDKPTEVDPGDTHPNIIYGGGGDDRLHAGQHGDRIYGGAGNDHIGGNFGDDWIDGGEGADQIDGGRGNDVIHGGAGDDWIDGWFGNDILTGGPGNDEFSYRKINNTHSYGTDIITDFKDGDDKILLSARLAIAQVESIVAGANTSGPAGAYTGVTIDLGHAQVDGFDGVIHILFEGTATAFDVADFA